MTPTAPPADGAGASPPELERFLRASGLLGSADAWSARPLAGGVSCDIWKVDLPGGAVVVKRALARLRVAADWRAPVSRNATEWAWFRFARGVLPESVPEPLAHDAGLGFLAMRYLPPETHRLWKRELLDGHVDIGFAAAVGARLVRLHAASAGRADLAREFDTLPAFHALRLDAYLLATARVHADLVPTIEALVARTAATRVALVHGDVSPKNLLIGPQGPVFLDAETAWYGDPAFDLAFCLNHLLLKCMVRREAAPRLLAAYAALAQSYRDGVDWEAAVALEARAASLLPALLLARVDGKSPVEYLVDERDRERVRGVARGLIGTVGARLDDVAQAWRSAIR